jgi:hypothetical protein
VHDEVKLKVGIGNEIKYVCRLMVVLERFVNGLHVSEASRAPMEPAQREGRARLR